MMTQYGVAMYAVFQSGGKQHRVSEGQTVRLEKLELEIEKLKKSKNRQLRWWR